MPSIIKYFNYVKFIGLCVVLRKFDIITTIGLCVVLGTFFNSKLCDVLRKFSNIGFSDIENGYSACTIHVANYSLPFIRLSLNIPKVSPYMFSCVC